MSIYTFWGNKNEQVDGTSVLMLASGALRIGHSGDFTSQELDFYSRNHILKPGTVAWTRTDFPWAIEDTQLTSSRSTSGGAAGSSWKDPVASLTQLPSNNNTIADVRVTQDTFTAYVWNGSSWQLLAGAGGGGGGGLTAPIDGGTSNTTYTQIIDGGSSSTSSFALVIDGGTS